MKTQRSASELLKAGYCLHKEQFIIFGQPHVLENYSALYQTISLQIHKIWYVSDP